MFSSIPQDRPLSESVAICELSRLRLLVDVPLIPSASLVFFLQDITGLVDVSRSDPLAFGGYVWTVTFRKYLGEVPLLVASGAGMSTVGTVNTAELQKGVTEVQTITTQSDGYVCTACVLVVVRDGVPSVAVTTKTHLNSFGGPTQTQCTPPPKHVVGPHLSPGSS